MAKSKYVYSYDPKTYELISKVLLDENDISVTGEFILPAFTTSIVPPNEIKEGYLLKFSPSENVWNYIQDKNACTEELSDYDKNIIYNEKINELNLECKINIIKGFKVPFNNYFYPCTETDQNNYIAAVCSKSEKSYFKVYEDEKQEIELRQEHTLEESEKVIIAMNEHIQGNIKKCWELKTQVNELYIKLRNREFYLDDFKKKISKIKFS